MKRTDSFRRALCLLIACLFFAASTLRAADDLATRAEANTRIGVAVRVGRDLNASAASLEVEAADFSDQELSRIIKSIPEIQDVTIKAGELSVRGWGALKRLSNLQVVSIGCSVTDADILALNGISTLKRFLLGVPPVPAPPLGAPLPPVRITDKAFANARSWPNLEVIEIFVLDYIGEKAISPFSRVKSPIIGCAITDRTLQSFAACRKLTKMSFSHHMMTGNGLKSLANLPELRELTLISGKEIGDSSVATLGRMKLHALVLTGTGYTAEGIKKLVRLMPQTTIVDAEGNVHKPAPQ